MSILKDKWRLTKASKSQKSQVLQVFYNPGTSMGGLNPAFIVGGNSPLKGGVPKVGMRRIRIGRKIGDNRPKSIPQVKALFSFKNIKSLEAAVKVVKKRRISRILRAIWFDSVGVEHTIVKKGKLITNLIKTKNHAKK